MRTILACLLCVAAVGCDGEGEKKKASLSIVKTDLSAILAIAEAEAIATHPAKPTPAPQIAPEPDAISTPQGAAAPAVEPPPKPVAFTSQAMPVIHNAVYRTAEEPPVQPLPSVEDLHVHPLAPPSAPAVCTGSNCANGSCAVGACASGACANGSCLASGGPVRNAVGFFRERRPVRRLFGAICQRRPVRRILGAPFRLFCGGCR